MKRHTLEDIKSVEDIEGLTVRQMKEVLVKNFVDYKGCVEKSELQDRVTRLWKEHQVNKQKSEYRQGQHHSNTMFLSSTLLFSENWLTESIWLLQTAYAMNFDVLCVYYFQLKIS